MRVDRSRRKTPPQSQVERYGKEGHSIGDMVVWDGAYEGIMWMLV